MSSSNRSTSGLKDRILALIAELRGFDAVLVANIETLMREGDVDATAIRALPGSQDALRKSWRTVFEKRDAIYEDMRTAFEVRFRRDALLLIEEASRQLGDVAPPSPATTAHGHPDPDVRRQLEISRAYGCLRRGFPQRGTITTPSQLSYIADYLQTLLERLG